MKKNLIIVILLSILAACASPDVVTSTPSLLPSATATNTPMPDALWISPAVPPDLLAIAKSWDIPITIDPALATQKLDAADASRGALWIYGYLLRAVDAMVDECRRLSPRDFRKAIF